MRERLGRSFSSRTFLFLVVLIPLLSGGVCQIANAARYLSFRGDTTFPESAVVQTALWARATGRIYPGLDQSPYTPAPYGPLFYISLKALATTVGGNFTHLLVLARIMTFAGFLVLAFAAYAWGRRHELRPAVAMVGPALLLSQIDFEAWNASVRPDIPALLATFLAFFLLTTAPVSARRVAVAGLLCGVAGLLKQSYIAFPLCIVLWLFTTRRWRPGVIFMAAMLVVGLAVFLPLGLTHEPFVSEMLLARYSPISFLGALQLLKADFLSYPGQFVLLGLGVAGFTRMDRNLVSAKPLIGAYFLLVWLTCFYTAMAPGASVNAFLEAWVVTSACAAFAVNDLAEDWGSITATARTVVLLLWAAIMMIDLNYWRVLVSVRPSSAYGTLAEVVQGRRVLADIPYVAAHGSNPELLDPSVNHYLELAGKWSPHPILQELQRGSFDYVVVGMDGTRPREWRGLTIFSTSILTQIAQDYRPLCISNRFAVYIPRSRAAVERADEFKRAGCHPVGPNDAGIELVPGKQER